MLDMRTSEVTTLSGSSEEPGVVDSALEDARFSGPRGIGCLPDGNSLIVADDGALRLIDLEAGQVTTVAGQPGVPGNEDGSAVRARIGYLIHAIAETPDGSKALLSDRSNDSIRAVDLQTYEVSTISTSSDGWSGPGGLAFDPAQTTSQKVWVADTFANRIRSLDIETGDIVELGASESPQGIVIHNGTALSIGFGNAITQTDLITGETSTLSTEFGGAFASPLVINNEMVYAEPLRASGRFGSIRWRIDWWRGPNNQAVLSMGMALMCVLVKSLTWSHQLTGLELSSRMGGTAPFVGPSFRLMERWWSILSP